MKWKFKAKLTQPRREDAQGWPLCLAYATANTEPTGSIMQGPLASVAALWICLRLLGPRLTGRPHASAEMIMSWNGLGGWKARVDDGGYVFDPPECHIVSKH
jgi:hypothetical protein